MVLRMSVILPIIGPYDDPDVTPVLPGLVPGIHAGT